MVFFKNLPHCSSFFTLRNMNKARTFKNMVLQWRVCTKRSLFVQTMYTPNEHSLKFMAEGYPIANSMMGKLVKLEFTSVDEAINAPLAKKILEIPAIKSVFFGPDYITVEKDPVLPLGWTQLSPLVCSIIKTYLLSGKPIISDSKLEKKVIEDQYDDYSLLTDDQKLLGKVQELIDSRIRPFIQEDGGDVQIIGLKKGWLKLKLQGACRSCPSSTITLRY